ncbi:hypothetical protein MTO96_028936 [Rhipicephalus appendiculatus]
MSAASTSSSSFTIIRTESTSAIKELRKVDTLTDTKYTFGELLDASRHVAAGLHRLGLRTEDVVAFHGPNSCDLLVAMCGTFFAGGTGMLCKSSLTLVYGMTELAGFITCSTHLEDLKSVGKPVPFVEMKVVDFHTRETLGPNQQGEICVKSPGAFKAYLNQPKATADAFEDGFVRTGLLKSCPFSPSSLDTLDLHTFPLFSVTDITVALGGHDSRHSRFAPRPAPSSSPGRVLIGLEDEAEEWPLGFSVLPVSSL